MENIAQKTKQPIIYIIFCFALLCWILLFYQILSGYFIPAQKTIPAFLPVTDISDQNHTMLSYPVSSFSDASTNRLPNHNTMYQFLKQYDKEIRLISYHTEKNYTDLYFYSPALQKKNPSSSGRNFNLQVAITNSTVYFGTPFLQYDF